MRTFPFKQTTKTKQAVKQAGQKDGDMTEDVKRLKLMWRKKISDWVEKIEMWMSKRCSYYVEGWRYART